MLVIVANLCLMGCSTGATTAHQVYGPSGHQFSVSFPSQPKAQSNTPGLLEGVPGASKAYGYDVSPEPNIFSSEKLPVPRPPTFGVAVIVMRSASSAKSVVQTLSQTPGVKPIAESGSTGYEFIGSENSGINEGTKISDPTASEGTLFLDRGTTVYVVLVVTARLPAAKAFLASFKAVQ